MVIPVSYSDGVPLSLDSLLYSTSAAAASDSLLPKIHLCLKGVITESVLNLVL